LPAAINMVRQECNVFAEMERNPRRPPDCNVSAIVRAHLGACGPGRSSYWPGQRNRLGVDVPRCINEERARCMREDYNQGQQRVNALNAREGAEAEARAGAEADGRRREEEARQAALRAAQARSQAEFNRAKADADAAAKRTRDDRLAKQKEREAAADTM